MKIGGSKIKPGISINIRRSDGRVHPAIVACVHLLEGSVDVEWFEKGETKGKEVPVSHVLSLNPDLHGGEEEEESPFKLDPVLEVPQDTGADPPLTARRALLLRTHRLSHSPRSTYNMSIPDQPVSRPASASLENGVQKLSQSLHIPSSVKRPINVVKVVDKLKKSRDERRSKFAEKRSEKESSACVEAGSPNWEYLSMIREYRATLDFCPLRSTDPVECLPISVCVRKRPLNRRELSKKEIDVISVPKKDTVILHEPKVKVDLTKFIDHQQFRFDYAFDEHCDNETVYRFTAQPLVKTIFEGGMATCFAYGQTGSGKTHTMGGSFSGKAQDYKSGIYAMVARDVVDLVNSPSYKKKSFIITASFFEIYGGKLYDLLGDRAPLKVLEDGNREVQVVGLIERTVKTVEHVLGLIRTGNQARTCGSTSANANSSRSHAVFRITLRCGNNRSVYGKFSLVDLAGNERGADTSSSDRVTRMEGAEINKSLLALKECIRALCRKKSQHLPFRTSKLTQVLRDSFIGDKSNTCMIAMISPSINSSEHSLNTLRYANRVKEFATDQDTGVNWFNEGAMDCTEISDEEDNCEISALENELWQSLNEMNSDVSKWDSVVKAALRKVTNRPEALKVLNELEKAMASRISAAKAVRTHAKALKDSILKEDINFLVKEETKENLSDDDQL